MADFEIKDGIAITPEGITSIGVRAFEDCSSLTRDSSLRLETEFAGRTFRSMPKGAEVKGKAMKK